MEAMAVGRPELEGDKDQEVEVVGAATSELVVFRSCSDVLWRAYDTVTVCAQPCPHFWDEL